MPKLIINNLNIKEKNADKNGTTGYRVKIDGGNPIEFRKKYLEVQVPKGEHEVTIFRTGLKKVVKKIKVVGKEAKVSVRIDVSLPIMMVILQLIINNFVFPKLSLLRTIFSVIFLILFLYLMFMREVIKVDVLNKNTSVMREIVLVKIKANAANRNKVVEIANIYKGSVIDLSPESMIVEVTGKPTKINAFIKILEDFEILEICRTGITAMSRDSDESIIRQKK